MSTSAKAKTTTNNQAGKAHAEKVTKKARLIAALSMPHGIRAALVEERLGWQAHTVRAALSGLRKQGFEIETTKAAKSGERVYRIVGQKRVVESAGHAAATEQTAVTP